MARGVAAHLAAGRKWATVDVTRVILTGAVVLAYGCGADHPTDEVLLGTFRTHRAELEKLVEMFKADRGLGRVGSNFTRPEDPKRVSVSADRIAEYRRLCVIVGAADCIEGYEAPMPRFMARRDPAPRRIRSGFTFPAKGCRYRGHPRGTITPNHLRPTWSPRWRGSPLLVQIRGCGTSTVRGTCTSTTRTSSGQGGSDGRT